MVSLIFPAIIAAMGAIDGDSPERLLVSARAAVAEISPASGDRQLVTLPTLHFSLAIEPLCGATARVESISVSAADTRQTFGVEYIDKQAVIDAALSIPDRQLGPIRIGDFCRSTDVSTAAAGELIIQGALTAHLALRCVRDQEFSVTYVSQPLDIILRCIVEDDPASVEPSENQESSVESEPRL